ncbi:MAG: phosphoglucosamine mutase [Planctomycetota bacterium]|nr:MAG: phosphoglucosamine mutase [Planctomycetota bacterium]
MSNRLFGTDGMRGRAGEEPLTAATLERLGRILGARLGGPGRAVLLGHDGRESGEELTAALVEGLNAAGCDADVLGLAPTPAVMFLTGDGPYDAGVVVSASHNPAEDNGVKLLGGDGAKLADAEEEAIERALRRGEPAAAAAVPGRRRRVQAQVGDYLAWLRNTAFPDLDLRGWKVVLDAANGAWSRLGPRVLQAFGAEVVPVNAAPDGRNINLDCGALHPQKVATAVVEHGACAGLSVDGDGDRGLIADGDGRVLDGDAILAGLGRHMMERGELTGGTVVATVMSNLALEQWLRAVGADLHRTPVGDRHVAAALREHGWCLGGEKSGHILFGPEHDFRGDGLYTFLRVAQALVREGKALTEFAAGYADLPQTLLNLPARARRPLAELPRLSAEIARLDREMGPHGRSVVRFSGTELLLRIMVEGDSEELVEDAVSRLRAAAEADGILAE